MTQLSGRGALPDDGTEEYASRELAKEQKKILSAKRKKQRDAMQAKLEHMGSARK